MLFICRHNLLFSRDVTAAMLVSPTNPQGIELYSYADFFLWFWSKNMLGDHVSENTLLCCGFFKWHSTQRGAKARGLCGVGSEYSNYKRCLTNNNNNNVK